MVMKPARVLFLILQICFMFSHYFSIDVRGSNSPQQQDNHEEKLCKGIATVSLVTFFRHFDYSRLPRWIEFSIMIPMWVLGVVLILLGSLGNNLGNNLVSLFFQRQQDEGKNSTTTGNETESKDDAPKDGSEIKDGSESKDVHPHNVEAKKKIISLWSVGVTIFVLGNLLTFASFGFAAQSLLASLESVQFVSNVFFVKYVHKEVVTWRMIISTASIVVGNTLVVLFSDHAAVLYSSEQLLTLYRTNTAYQAYLVVAFVMWALAHYTYTTYYKSRMLNKKFLWQHQFLEPFSFALSSAIMGTQAVLQSKCMSILIQDSARGDNEFKKPTIYVVLVAWLCFVAYWLNRLNKGLELFPPLFIIPVLQVFFVFFAIVCGGIYFEEFNTFSSVQWIGFVIGVMMILGGVFGLAPVDGDMLKCGDEEDEDQAAHRMSAALELVSEGSQRLSRRMSERVSEISERVSISFSSSDRVSLNFGDVYQTGRESVSFQEVEVAKANRPISTTPGPVFTVSSTTGPALSNPLHRV